MVERKIVGNQKPKSACAGTISDALRRSADSNMSLYFDKIVEVQSKIYDKGMVYNNVIVTIIYAGFLFLLNFLKENLEELDVEIVAILMIVSLTAFALWTVGNGYSSSQKVKKFSQIVSDPDKSIERKLADIQVVERNDHRSTLRHFGRWVVAFQVALLSGFAGVFYLIILLVADFLGFDMGMQELWVLIKERLA